MTRAARIVLEDCRAEAGNLSDPKSPSDWRRRWVTSIALLRAVGHVLGKVDADSDPKLKTAISAWWEAVRKRPAGSEIFWDFILRERNSMLKEYKTAAKLSVLIDAGDIDASLIPKGGSLTIKPAISFTHSMKDGPFAGKDYLELINEAICWWESQLNAIDVAVREKPRS